MDLLRSLHAAYRATGADLPFGHPLAAHGVAMEGYYWRVTDVAAGRVLAALIGVNRGPRSHWATLGLLAHPGGALALDAHEGAGASEARLEVRAGEAFRAHSRELHVDLGPDARLDLVIEDPLPWPRRSLGGSSIFHTVPHLNQYWHPWLLGGRASGRAVVGGETWEFEGAQVYGEKNWGREGFPDAWWWGQAHGFADDDACVAFAGGQVTAGWGHVEVTALAVRLPGGHVVRLGDPVISPVRADISDSVWELRGHGHGWSIAVRGEAPLSNAHVLPVPLPSEHRNTAGAIEHLAGNMRVVVQHGGRVVWRGVSALAGLEHGGLDRAEAELRRRGAPAGAVGAPPHHEAEATSAE